MKLNRLSDDKLQIIISKTDLERRNMKKWDLVPYNPEAQELFQEILEKAHVDLGFEVKRDTQLIVEAYPVSGESMIMTITKVVNLEQELKQLIEIGDRLKSNIEIDSSEKNKESSELNHVYEFNNIDDIIDASALIVAGYDYNSKLYRTTNGSYYIYFEDVNQLDEKFIGHLLEYGYQTRYSHAYLVEHTDLIISDDAIKKLAKL